MPPTQHTHCRSPRHYTRTIPENSFLCLEPVDKCPRWVEAHQCEVCRRATEALKALAQRGKGFGIRQR